MGTSDERHPTAWWKDGRDFEAMLSGHADHKACYGLDWKLAELQGAGSNRFLTVAYLKCWKNGTMFSSIAVSVGASSSR
jgi:hypothetical protein